MNMTHTSTALRNDFRKLVPSLPQNNYEHNYAESYFKNLPEKSFNLIETADNFSGLLKVADFLASGLQQGEMVTLVAFDQPDSLLEKFMKLGHDFHDDFLKGRLCILSYKPTFTRSLNISTDYQALFSEISSLSKSKSAWIAFLNADLLFNLESHNLTTVSVSKVHAAARCVNGKILAQFTTTGSIHHQRLRNISASLLDFYLTTEKPDQVH
ncbi:MAG: hypothetical protein ACPG51_10040 [Thiolinea sp.]